MIKMEMFLRQLINSVVRHTTQESFEANDNALDYQQFMVRAELERRFRELYREKPVMDRSRSELTLRVIADMFFNGDLTATQEQWGAATVEDPDGYYELEMRGLGSTTITAIDVTTNLRVA